MSSNPFKILYISHLHPPKGAPLDNVGGMQRVSLQLTEALEKMPDIQVKELTQEAPWKGIELYTAKFLAKLYFTLPKTVESFKPDIILFSSMVTASLAKLLRKKIDVPMVTINHGQDVTLPISAYQKFLPAVFAALNGVISVSRATREACLARGLDAKKAHVLPNGFDTKTFPTLPDKNAAKQALEKHFDIALNDRKVLLTVGRKVKRKGHEWFITQVLPKVKTQVLYLTVGDGPESERLNELIENTDMVHTVKFAGRISDSNLKQMYAAADVFVMPNIRIPGDMEGFGVVMLEANSAGCPVVASALEGILDVVEDAENGYLIPEGDSTLFAQRIDDYLQSDLNVHSQKCRNFVLNKFSWPNVASSYVNLLKELAR